LVEGFTDVVSCYVLGYVYATPGDALDFRRADTCTGVRHELLDEKLVLYSPTHWVEVDLPTAGGYHKFWYRWGTETAYVGAQSIAVTWGRTIKG
jgi:hypothetical protein